MVRVVEAVYKGGVLKPLADPGLPEHQRVVLEIHVPGQADAESCLQAWRQVYEGLSDDDVTEIEKIALGRSQFFRPGPR